MVSRQARLLELITENGKMEVARLAELLGVSQVTIRKDLIALEEKGILRREHGYALLYSGEDISSRLAYHYESKRRIAQAAAAMVSDGETVMIESGSCCALLAEELASTHRDVTIVTNSAFIANYVRRRSGARIVLLGGNFQNESQVMVGPMTRQCAENYFVDKLFVGADGYIDPYGFTGSDLQRAEAVRDMARQASRVIVLTESQKFAQKGTVALLPIEKVAMVVTDEELSDATVDSLQARGAKIIRVSDEGKL
ncbi:MAG: DeoR/GlpR family DNA-binding transcription regulator [Clostridia bacterium]|nr:DeoR/GlpR family DNA-binding transcription regulator [Clostridia bacterium]